MWPFTSTIHTHLRERERRAYLVREDLNMERLLGRNREHIHDALRQAERDLETLEGNDPVRRALSVEINLWHAAERLIDDLFDRPDEYDAPVSVLRRLLKDLLRLHPVERDLTSRPLTDNDKIFLEQLERRWRE